MTRLLIGIFVSIILVACHTDKTPKDVVARKDMVALLSDFHLAEGYISSLPLDSSRLVAKGYYAAVFKKHHTDSVGFHKSLLYYAKSPNVLDQIYIEVQQKLQQLQSTEQGILDAKMRKVFVADSIKNAAITDSLDKIKTDSVNWKLTKNLFYWKHPDSAKIKPKPWSLQVYEALVQRSLNIKGSTAELHKLLSPTDSTAKIPVLDTPQTKKNSNTK